VILGYEDFYAIHDQQPGPDGTRPLRVGGTVIFPTPGYSARLERFEGNPGINPMILPLVLVVRRPDQETQPEVVTPVEIPEFTVDARPGQYTEVHFRLDGGDPDDEPPPVIPVQTPS
jgi:hypothetical protein